MDAETLIGCIERTLADTRPAAGWPEHEWACALGRARGTLETALAFAKAAERADRVRGATTDFMERNRK